MEGNPSSTTPNVDLIIDKLYVDKAFKNKIPCTGLTTLEFEERMEPLALAMGNTNLVLGEAVRQGILAYGEIIDPDKALRMAESLSEPTSVASLSVIAQQQRKLARRQLKLSGNVSTQADPLVAALAQIFSIAMGDYYQKLEWLCSGFGKGEKECHSSWVQHVKHHMDKSLATNAEKYLMVSRYEPLDKEELSRCVLDKLNARLVSQGELPVVSGDYVIRKALEEYGEEVEEKHLMNYVKQNDVGDKLIAYGEEKIKTLVEKRPLYASRVKFLRGVVATAKRHRAQLQGAQRQLAQRQARGGRS